MADFDPLGSPGAESANFENDFEKVDQLTHAESDELVTSTSMIEHSAPEADMLEPQSTVLGSSEAEPLISLGGQSQPEEPAPAAQAPVTPEAPVAPTFVPEPEPIKPTPVPVHPEPVKPAAFAAPIASKASPKPAPGPSAGESTSECWVKNVDPRVLDLIYWRDPKKTGVVFGSMLVLLLSLALFSVLSVAAYLSLSVLTITVSFVVYKKVLMAVQKSGSDHPFHDLLGMDFSVPEEKVQEAANIVVRNATCVAKELRHLFLVEDMVDSLKFGLLLWVLTYIGSWFNGMTLLILGLIGLFTLPKVYEQYKTEIDQYLDLAKTHINNTIAMIKEKLPLPGKKKAEKQE